MMDIRCDSATTTTIPNVPNSPVYTPTTTGTTNQTQSLLLLLSDSESQLELPLPSTTLTTSTTTTESPPTEILVPAVSDLAARRFPLTSRLAKKVVDNVNNDGVRVVVPDENLMVPFERYYNSRGELVVPAEDLPPPPESALPPTYDVASFPLIYPLVQRNPITVISQEPPLPKLAYPQTSHPSASIPIFPPPAPPAPPSIIKSIPPTSVVPYPQVTLRLCKTRNCNAILPIMQYPYNFCKRCCSSTAAASSNPIPPSRRSDINPDPRAPSSPRERIPAAPSSLLSRSTFASSAKSVLAGYSDRSTPSIGCSTTTNASDAASSSSSTVGKKRARVEEIDSTYLQTPAVSPSATATAPTTSTTPSAPSQPHPPLISAHANTPQVPLPVSHPRPRRIPLPRSSRHRGDRHIAHTRHLRSQGPTILRKPVTRAALKETSGSKPSVPTFSPSSTIINLPDPTVLRLNNATGEERRCITSSCTNVIPSSSSPYTLRCPPCIRIDWNARRSSIEKNVMMMMKSGEEVEEEKGQKERRKKQKKKKALSDSLSSLSSLTSLEGEAELGEVDDDRCAPAAAAAAAKGAESSLATLPDVLEGSPDKSSVAAAQGSNSTPLEPRPPKLVLRIPSVVWHSAKAFRYCADDRCWRRLDAGYDGSSRCIQCRAKEREKEMASMRRVQSGFLGDEDDETEEEEEEEEIMGEVIPGARLCVSPQCSHVIPTTEEYKGDMCMGCCCLREPFLFKKRRRREVSSSSVRDKKREEEQAEHEKKEDLPREGWWGGGVAFGIRDVKEAQPGGRCSSLDCGMLVGSGDGGAPSLCLQCVRRKAREMERIRRVREAKAKEPQAVGHQQHASLLTEPHAGNSKTAYPEYISLSALTAQLRTQLYAFLHDQAVLALHRRRIPASSDQKAASAHLSREGSTATATAPATLPPPSNPAAPQLIQALPPLPTTKPTTPLLQPTLNGLFTFTGQFSSVSSTPHLLHPSHKPSIVSHMVYVRSEIERASHFQMKFRKARNSVAIGGDPVVTFDEGFALRLECAHSIPLSWFVPGGEDQSEGKKGASTTAFESDSAKVLGEGTEKSEWEDEEMAKRVMKDIKGELDIIIVADPSHPVLPGQTTVVRFRMGVIEFS